MLVFEERGKPEYPEKNVRRSRVENQQQTQPTYDTGSGSGTRDTLVGGERSHHCAIPAPHAIDYFTITAEILARSLANFYRQYADRQKQIDVSF